MRHLLITVAAMAVAAPAMALNITNLDHGPHRVAYVVSGNRQESDIAPGATLHINGQPNGVLLLVSSPAPKQGGAVNADGMLSGYIGNGRDQNIPVDQADDYVIWPGGNMLLQRRMKSFSRW